MGDILAVLVFAGFFIATAVIGNRKGRPVLGLALGLLGLIGLGIILVVPPTRAEKARRVVVPPTRAEKARRVAEHTRPYEGIDLRHAAVLKGSPTPEGLLKDIPPDEEPDWTRLGR